MIITTEVHQDEA